MSTTMAWLAARNNQYWLRGELQNEVILDHLGAFPNLFAKRQKVISRLIEWADSKRTLLTK